MLRVGAPARVAEAPPMLRVAPALAPPPIIVLPPPVAPQAADADTFAPAADAASVFAPPAFQRPSWPVLDAPVAHRIPKRAWTWGGIAAAVFAAGWLGAVVSTPTHQGEPGPFTRMLRAVGLGAPHFVASVNSTPNGAWIAVDGKDVAQRTPAVVELSPGPHAITLSLPELGSTQVQVRGEGGEKVAVNPSLNGGLEVYSSDARVPISVALDGRDVGYAPVRLELVAPGLHELQFTGPGMPAWAQTVQVGVHRTAQVVAHPMSAPANGVVQVQATLNDERGASSLSGAQVWVDGQLRGVAPASLELPRGPHSLKLTWHGETAPVQVIDLPGGNRRFASFGFGLETPSPQVVLLGGVHPASANEQVVLSATLTTLQLGDVREAWLHVSTPEGLWRRYPMTAMRGARGPVLVCVFPPASLAGGSARWYVSASTLQGDEYFSEMQVASVGGGATRPRRHGSGSPTP